jgi:hypothetical protein
MNPTNSKPIPSQRSQLVFLSYSRRDAGIVKKFGLIIWAAGMIPWRDEEAIPPGVRWEESIATTIQECNRMLVFWCRHARASAEVRKEYWQAIDCNKPLVPVRLDHSAIPMPLSRFQAIDTRRLTWWSHEIARWDRYPWFIGLLLMLIGGLYSLL